MKKILLILILNFSLFTTHAMEQDSNQKLTTFLNSIEYTKKINDGIKLTNLLSQLECPSMHMDIKRLLLKSKQSILHDLKAFLIQHPDMKNNAEFMKLIQVIEQSIAMDSEYLDCPII